MFIHLPSLESLWSSQNLISEVWKRAAPAMVKIGLTAKPNQEFCLLNLYTENLDQRALPGANKKPHDVLL